MCSQPQKDIKIVYEKICQAHDAITDFRAKLLALLPIASGAGIFLLIGSKPPDPELVPYLLPIGIVGALVAFGFFCYELRGIQECHVLRDCGIRFEEKLAAELSSDGRFNSKRKAFLFFGVTGASLIIYPSVIGAWIYVATVGFRAAIDRPKGLDIQPFITVWPIVAFVALSLIGWTVVRSTDLTTLEKLRKKKKAERAARATAPNPPLSEKKK